METLKQERLIHSLTLDMGNRCGYPTDKPGGGRATSADGNVTCQACREILAEKGRL
jgi:hypothetical protein